jgi:hypothetical protein
MLSLTIFAVAASAATQSPPAALPEQSNSPFAERPQRAAAPERPAPDRHLTVWRFTDPGVDGGQIWL